MHLEGNLKELSIPSCACGAVADFSFLICLGRQTAGRGTAGRQRFVVQQVRNSAALKAEQVCQEHAGEASDDKFFWPPSLAALAAPVIHVAFDAVRIHGLSRMMGFMTLPGGTGGWLPPQALAP